MNEYLTRSRIAKVLTDGGDDDFAAAELRLAAVRLAVVIADSELASPAAQACAVTVLATATRTFSNVNLVTASDVVLSRTLPNALTLIGAAHSMSAVVCQSVPKDATHVILIGRNSAPADGFVVRCWWNEWLTGVRDRWDEEESRGGWNPLAGSFAGAVAVREVFASMRGTRSPNPSVCTISLWAPWDASNNASAGPSEVYLARTLAVVGLGHIGQGILWNLGLIPGHGETIVLQDYQYAGTENQATGLLTSRQDIGRRKTRIAADWCEHHGWKTTLIEKMFVGGTKALPDDPPLIVSALDSPEPRQNLLAAGFACMLDVGVGHGPSDFEQGQMRTFYVGDQGSWDNPGKPKNNDDLLKRKAYQALHDQCGAFQLASASVAVPFVGAAFGALAVAQILRLGAMLTSPRLFQFEMSAPEMPSFSGLMPERDQGMGTISVNLRDRTFRNA
jgi:hypothetical protein